MLTTALTWAEIAESDHFSGDRMGLEIFEGHFGRAAVRFDPSIASSAWMPFFHLSRRVGIWTLWKGTNAASFSSPRGNRPTSVGSLRKRVDQTRVNPGFLDQLRTSQGPQAIRHAAQDLIPWASTGSDS
jgi:hypothetical protein